MYSVKLCFYVFNKKYLVHHFKIHTITKINIKTSQRVSYPETTPRPSRLDTTQQPSLPNFDELIFFRRLFEENQDLLNMFEKFRQCRTKEEQINSMELAEHANNVMNTLDEGIKGLDDLDNFFGYIHQVGASHRRIPGFKVEYFWVSDLFVCF